MHHLDKEKVEAIMEKVKQVVDSGQYPADIIEEIFKWGGFIPQDESLVDGSDGREIKETDIIV